MKMSLRLSCGRVKLLLITLLMCMISMSAVGKSPKAITGAPAKQLFTKVYNSVFGPQGSSLNYSVNIIGIYKTQGLIVYKGKKLHYSESRFCAWEDGVNAYMVDKKNKEVNLYRYDDDNKDKYLSKFKYDVNNFDFSYITQGNYYLITAKVRNAGFFGIRSVTAKVTRESLVPESMTIKLSIFSTTVKISNFRSGKIADSNFIFPKDKFRDYKFTDHRKD